MGSEYTLLESGARDRWREGFEPGAFEDDLDGYPTMTVFWASCISPSPSSSTSGPSPGTAVLVATVQWSGTTGVADAHKPPCHSNKITSTRKDSHVFRQHVSFFDHGDLFSCRTSNVKGRFRVDLDTKKRTGQPCPMY